MKCRSLEYAARRLRLPLRGLHFPLVVTPASSGLVQTMITDGCTLGAPAHVSFFISVYSGCAYEGKDNLRLEALCGISWSLGVFSGYGTGTVREVFGPVLALWDAGMYWVTHHGYRAVRRVHLMRAHCIIEDVMEDVHASSSLTTSTTGSNRHAPPQWGHPPPWPGLLGFIWQTRNDGQNWIRKPNSLFRCTREKVKKTKEKHTFYYNSNRK